MPRRPAKPTLARQATLPILERFAASFIQIPSGCWVWTRTIGHYDYALFYAQKRVVYGHRFIYELIYGELPLELLVIDHLCRETRCVNPAHLEAVTHQENTRRGMVLLKRTRCIRGHEFTDDNVIVGINRYGTKRRTCRKCYRVKNAAREARVWALNHQSKGQR